MRLIKNCRLVTSPLHQHDTDLKTSIREVVVAVIHAFAGGEIVMGSRHKSQFSPCTDPDQDTHFRARKKTPAVLFLGINVIGYGVTIHSRPQSDTRVRKEVLAVSHWKIVLTTARDT